MDVGHRLFDRFLADGFGSLSNAEPEELATYLEDRAAAGGGAHLLFLSEAIRAVDIFFHDHDEYGGVRLGFLRQLDTLVRERLPAIIRSEPPWAAELARDFRDATVVRIRSYDPGDTYE